MICRRLRLSNQLGRINFTIRQCHGIALYLTLFLILLPDLVPVLIAAGDPSLTASLKTAKQDI